MVSAADAIALRSLAPSQTRSQILLCGRRPNDGEFHREERSASTSERVLPLRRV